MNEHVYPLLRRTHTAEVRSALCGAAAEQTYLLGWMAFDNGEHGTAQRYLVQALRLAEESGDVPLGAHVLAGMADQATLLGNPAEGRRLAQAGRHGLRNVESPVCLADLWALEARALAVLGDKRGNRPSSDQVRGRFRPCDRRQARVGQAHRRRLLARGTRQHFPGRGSARPQRGARTQVDRVREETEPGPARGHVPRSARCLPPSAAGPRKGPRDRYPYGGAGTTGSFVPERGGCGGRAASHDPLRQAPAGRRLHRTGADAAGRLNRCHLRALGQGGARVSPRPPSARGPGRLRDPGCDQVTYSTASDARDSVRP